MKEQKMSVQRMFLVVYLNSHLKMCFINFRENKGGEREVGGEYMDERERNTNQLLPDQEPNLQPFGIGDDDPSCWATHPRLKN